MDLKNRFGNIYVNLLNADEYVLNNQSTILHGASYMNNTVNYSLPMLKTFLQNKKVADQPNVFDPSFVFRFGSQKTQSNTFQQWIFTTSPATSYLRPWWLSTISLTMLSTDTFFINGDLSPGICPYYPSLTLDNLFDVSQLIEDTLNTK